MNVNFSKKNLLVPSVALGLVLLVLLSSFASNAFAYTCSIQSITVNPTAPAVNTQVTVTIDAPCTYPYANIPLFQTIATIYPAGVNRVLSTEPFKNGSNSTNILLTTPATPELWNLTAVVNIQQNTGQSTGMYTQNFTIPVGMP
ncbi:MAG: hypothetical protein ACLPY5_04690 [Candidatus Bathyarchaeia archaeon]